MRLKLSMPTGEVIITSEVIVQHEDGVFVSCPNCAKIGHLETAFGWRRMGAQVRNQPWCRKCRAAAAKHRPLAVLHGPATGMGACA